MDIKLQTTMYLKSLKNIVQRRYVRQLETLNDTEKEIKKINKELKRRQEFMGGHYHGHNHGA